MRLSGFLLACITLVACSKSEPPVTAGTLFVNVNGYSATSAGLSQFSELHIRDSVVVATGDGNLFGAANYENVIDGQGKTLLPGLIDAHGHVSSLGVAAEQVDLAGAGSLDDALGRVRRFADANPDAPWILGRGWNQVLWDGQAFPTRGDLDEIVDDKPVYLTRIDGHAGWANSRALQIAGINRESVDPQGGLIQRDGDGRPNGILVDAAMNQVTDAIPAATDADTRRYLAASMQRLASLGITNVHDAGTSLQEVRVLRMMAADSEMPIRIYVMLSGAEEVLDAVATPQVDTGSEHLAIRSVKIYSDGALGSRGAALTAPYADEPGQSGLIFHDVETLTAKIRKANEMGFQANVHAIGDFANKVVLDAFEQSAQGFSSPGQRNRIEHAQVLRLEDLDRFAELGVIASIQPTHATSDKNMAENRLGSTRIQGAYAWRKMLEAGARIAGGSDFPVEPANPMFGLHAAVTRQDRDNQPAGGWYPQEALTREEALRAFTTDAAYAGFQEARLGRIEPGYQADFIVIDRDYFEIQASDIWKIQVEETWVGGRKVYDSSETPR